MSSAEVVDFEEGQRSIDGIDDHLVAVEEELDVLVGVSSERRLARDPIAVVVAQLDMLATTVIAGPPDLVAAMARVARVFLPASLAATLACWLLTRRLLRFA